MAASTSSKVKELIKDMDGKPMADFTSKTLTALFAKQPKGKTVKVFIQEPNLPEQFVGTYTVGSPSTPPPHECPPGQHWDESQQKCVPDVVTPPTCPPGTHWDPASQTCVPDTTTPPGDLLWDSNIHGKWNDGNVRTITKKQGGQTADDKSIFVAASGSPKLIIDGNGIAHLQAGSGGVDNLSLKGLCSHQGNVTPLGANAPTDCSQRGGGEGFSIAHNEWDAKREKCHNIHSDLGGSGLSKAVQDNKWHKTRFSWKHEGSGIKMTGAIDYNDGAGYKQVMNLTDSNPEAWFMNKAGIKNSYFWIRINNSAHGRIYVMAMNWDAVLELEFMFEPAKNSIALRNVTLKAI